QDLGRRRLLLQGLLAERAQLVDRARKLRRAGAQFAEQPRVLDGDDRLGGEILQQRDLLVGKRPRFLPEDDDGADQFMVLEHRHAERGTRATDLDEGAVDTANVPVRHLPGPPQVAIDGIGAGPERPAFAEELVEFRQQVKRSRRGEYAVFMEEQYSDL